MDDHLVEHVLDDFPLAICAFARGADVDVRDLLSCMSAYTLSHFGSHLEALEHLDGPVLNGGHDRERLAGGPNDGDQRSVALLGLVLRHCSTLALGVEQAECFP